VGLPRIITSIKQLTLFSLISRSALAITTALIYLQNPATPAMHSQNADDTSLFLWS
jgi:hypothetical protein